MEVQTILVLLCVMLAECTVPAQDNFDKPYHNVIYNFNSEGNIVSPAWSGDTCNYNHRKVSELMTKSKTVPIPYAEFDTPCEAPSRCEFVLDKDGNPIVLSTEVIPVNAYMFTDNTARDVVTPILYKKCICPKNNIYNHAKRTCSDTWRPLGIDEIPPATGFYCEAGASAISPTLKAFILVILVTVRTIYFSC